MSCRSRTALLFTLIPGAALLLLLTLFTTTALSAGKEKEKGEAKRYPIKTGDGVDLAGTFYPALGAKKDAVVLMLHDFDRRGGSSHQPGFVDLAKALQDQGYAVLTFDFRGFGKSTSVNPEKFWAVPQNAGAGPRAAATKMPEIISHSDFAPGYYPNLVNDITAAKAFLDRKNDAREVNAGNVIVVGVGQGATLGALWMVSEFHRKKVLAVNALGVPKLDDPEGKDLAGAVWIGISPSLAGKNYPVGRWLQEIARDKKVRTGFVYGTGKDNVASEKLASACLDKARKMVARKPITAAVTGNSLLLANNKQAATWVVEGLLPHVMEYRGNREWKLRNSTDFAYLWDLGPGMVVEAKGINEETPRLLPINPFNR